MKQLVTSLLFATTCSSLALTAQAQSGTLTGTVQTAAGEALPGANVFIKGTFQSTATDREGKFTLPVSRQTTPST
jgi:iron complex outermembrane receptor protein